jgi:hypothetical protein
VAVVAAVVAVAAAVAANKFCLAKNAIIRPCHHR